MMLKNFFELAVQLFNLALFRSFRPFLSFLDTTAPASIEFLKPQFGFG